MIDALCFYSKQATSTADLDPAMQGSRAEGEGRGPKHSLENCIGGSMVIHHLSTTCCRPWTLTSTEQGA